MGGGGERGRLPAHTALDENGRVKGIDTGGYARKGGAKAPLPMEGYAPPAPAPRAPQPAYASAPAPSGPGPAAPVTSTPASPAPGTPSPAAPRPETARKGALRFSSISGFRRR
jgi:hypothetical protein